jgi:choline kinase
MKAIILAAGVGKRLAAVTRERPKCLVELGGRPLLIRYLDALLEAGVKRAAVVVGHKQEMIRRTGGESYRGLAVQYVVNDQYTRGSLYSLWLARVAFDDDVLIMDADVLCPSSFVARLVHSPHPNALLIDETVRQQVEERMAIIQGGRVVALTKKIPQEPPDLMGEGVGFLKVTRADTRFMLAAMEPYVTSGELDMEYEDTWESFFRTVSVGYETIGGQPWIEIDFPEDLERAEREIVPRLT